MDERVDHLWGGHKLILGPMVRASSLPLRLACLGKGATCVYSEEIPALKASSLTRERNETLNTIDFLTGEHNNVLFRTHEVMEQSKKLCVLQIGAADSVSALRAAQVFEKDVAAIDINMGCPKHFAVSTKMGAALMTRPETAEDIIKTLRRNLTIPISVKTRLQGNKSQVEGNVDTAATIEWAQRLQMSGAQAITIHARTPAEMYRDHCHEEVFTILQQKLHTSRTPLTYNGDIWTVEDRDRISHLTGITSFMICRAAMWNPAIFSRFSSPIVESGPLTTTSTDIVDSIAGTTTLEGQLDANLKELVVLSARTANCPLNTRYLMQQQLCAARASGSALLTRLREVPSGASSLLSLARLCGCESDVQAERRRQLLDVLRMTGGPIRGSGAPWPGRVAVGPHEYSDSYFDDNYYIAFRRVQQGQEGERRAYGEGSKRERDPVPGAAFEGLGTSSCVVQRVKRKKEQPVCKEEEEEEAPTCSAGVDGDRALGDDDVSAPDWSLVVD